MAHDDHKNTIKGCLFKICFCLVPEQSVILFFVSRYCVALNRSGYSSVHPFRSSFVRICILLDYKSSPLPADAAADRVSYLHSLSVVYKTESCQSNVDLKHTSFDPSALFPHPAICINPLIYTNLCVSHSQVFFACPMSCLVLPLCIEPTPTISPYQPYAWVVYQHRPPLCSDRGGGGGGGSACLKTDWRSSLSKLYQIYMFLQRKHILWSCNFVLIGRIGLDWEKRCRLHKSYPTHPSTPKSTTVAVFALLGIDPHAVI